MISVVCERMRGWGMSWKFVLSLLFALVVAVFAIQNAAAVDVQFLKWEVSISQALIVLIAAVIGALIVLLLSLVKQVKLMVGIHAEKKTATSLENENRELKEKLSRVLAELEALKQDAPSEEQRASEETQTTAGAEGEDATQSANPSGK
jgi:putative membrane protein